MSIFRDLGIGEEKNRYKEELLYNLGFCYVVLEKQIADVLTEFALSPIKMNALLMIKHVGQKQGITQVDLSKKLIVTAGNITRLLDRMEKEKLVERILAPGDRRIKRIKITSKAEKLLDKVWPVYIAKVDQILSSIPKSQVKTTTLGLDSLRVALMSKRS